MLEGLNDIIDAFGLLPLAGYWLAAALFLLYRGDSLLIFFQQEEYDGSRFLPWIFKRGFYDRYVSLLALITVAAGVSAYTTGFETIAAYILPIILIAGAGIGVMRSRKLLKDPKKPLVLTARLQRIRRLYWVLGAASLAVLTVIAAAFAPRYSLSVSVGVDHFAAGVMEIDPRWIIMATGTIVLAQIPPFLILISNMLLAPFEERVKAGYLTEARQKMAALDTTVIAITGSFGKTSTKHILGHILGAAAPTLATPGSVNTEMGVTRIVREKLNSTHRYFIVEMGAYGPGSITRLCRLTPPNMGLITAIGPAHYERFTSLETVARAKFELAEAVLKAKGAVLLNSDGIPAELYEAHKKRTGGPFIEIGAQAPWRVDDITETRDGIALTLEDPTEGSQRLQAPLYGVHQAGNIAVAATAARQLGLPWAVIRGALATVPQVRHRLEVNSTPGMPAIIDDAYNSNPEGFKSALKLLSLLRDEGGRRILITPGMVELGSEHESAHRTLGELAAEHVDIALLVTPERFPSFEEGLRSRNSVVDIHHFAKQSDAEAWAQTHWRAGDAVLFENNLPDLYEAKSPF